MGEETIELLMGRKTEIERGAVAVRRRRGRRVDTVAVSFVAIKPKRKLYAKFIKLVCDSIFICMRAASRVFFRSIEKQLLAIEICDSEKYVKVQLEWEREREQEASEKKSGKWKANQLSLRCRLSPCSPSASM